MAYVEGELVAKYRAPPILRTVQMLSALPPSKAICGWLVEATDNFHLGEVVAMPREPVKKESLVVVEIKLPTVSCDVVAMSVVPALSEVTMELAGNDVLFVPPLATVTVFRVMAPPPLPTTLKLVQERGDVHVSEDVETEPNGPVPSPYRI